MALARIHRARPAANAPASRVSWPLHLTMSEAADEVIVDHAGRLHVRVDDRRADEVEAALLHVLAEPVRQRRARRHLAAAAPAVDDRLAVDERPEVRIEAAG